MTPLIALLLGGVATWFSHHCFARTYAPDVGMEVVMGALAAVWWGGLALGTFDLQTPGGAAIDADALAYLSLVAALVMLLFAFQAAFGSLREVENVPTTEVGR